MVSQFAPTLFLGQKVSIGEIRSWSKNSRIIVSIRRLDGLYKSQDYLLSICWIFRAKSEEMTWQPCIILADVKQKAYARKSHLRVLSDTKEGLTMLFHSLSPKSLIVNGILKPDFS